MKNLYVIVGRSGSGKDSLVSAARDVLGGKILRTYTDRPKRTPDENTHVFVSEAEFSALQKKLCETEFAGYRYCTTLDAVSQADYCIFDIDGAKEIKRRYRKRRVKIIGITVPPSVAAERMKQRGDETKNIEKRLENDKEHFAELEALCDEIVENTSFGAAITKLTQYIRYCEAT